MVAGQKTVCLLIAGTVLCAGGRPAGAQSEGDRDTGFRVTLTRRTEQPAGVLAHFTTTASYPCEGYRLRFSVEQRPDTVTVTVLGMTRPTPCFRTMSRATGSVLLGLPGSHGTLVRIAYRGEADSYMMYGKGPTLSVVPLRNRFTTVR